MYYTAVTRCRAKLFLVELPGPTSEKLNSLYSNWRTEPASEDDDIEPVSLVEPTKLLPRQVSRHTEVDI